MQVMYEDFVELLPEEDPEFIPRSNLTKVPSGLLGVPTPPRAAATREATPRPVRRIRSKAEPPQEVESAERVTLGECLLGSLVEHKYQSLQ